VARSARHRVELRAAAAPKVLGLNDTQERAPLVFKFCDDQKLPLIDSPTCACSTCRDRAKRPQYASTVFSS